MPSKIETLTTALAARHEEVDLYDVNIGNYERAIARIDREFADREDLTPFRIQLAEHLESSRLERAKAAIIRDAIEEHLKDLGQD